MFGAEITRLLALGGSPGLIPRQRPGLISAADLRKALDVIFEKSKLSADRCELIHALILLAHDHSDEAHDIVQGIENPNGSFIHGIIHRREPDYGNAIYWFRRVGNHPVYPRLAARTTEFLRTQKELLLEAILIVDDLWQPLAFVQFCKQVSAQGSSHSQLELAQKIQALESEVLLHHLVNP